MPTNSTIYKLSSRSASTGMFQKVLPFVVVLTLGFFPWVGNIYMLTGVSSALILPVSILVGLNLVIASLLFLLNKSSGQKVSVQLLENFVQIDGLSRGSVSVPYSQIKEVLIKDLANVGLTNLILVVGPNTQKLSVSGFEKAVALEIQAGIQARIDSKSVDAHSTYQSIPVNGFLPKPIWSFRVVLAPGIMTIVLLGPIALLGIQSISSNLVIQRMAGIGFLVWVVWYCIRFFSLKNNFSYTFNQTGLFLRQGVQVREFLVEYSGMKYVILRQNWWDKRANLWSVVIDRGATTQSGLEYHSTVPRGALNALHVQPDTQLGLLERRSSAQLLSAPVYLPGVTRSEAEILRDVIIAHINSTTPATKSVL